MAILSKGNTYASGDSVTSTNLNALVDSATFVSGSNQTTDNSTLEVHSGGYLQVKDGGITNAKLAAGAVNASSIGAGTITSTQLANDSVDSAQLVDTAVTAGSYTNTDLTVDAQGRITAAASGSAGSGTPNWNSGWVNTDGTTSVANGATLNFTHNLGTTNLVIDVFVATDSSGSNALNVQLVTIDLSGNFNGCQIQDVTSTGLTLQLASAGYLDINSSGTITGASFASKYIKVVASASATVGAVNKYSTGWQNSIDSVTVANGSTHTITHSLGTDDVLVQVYVASDSSGTSSYLIANSGEFGSSGTVGYNAQINTLSSNTFELQLGSGGYFEITTSGNINTGNSISFASKYIKVVVIG